MSGEFKYSTIFLYNTIQNLTGKFCGIYLKYLVLKGTLIYCQMPVCLYRCIGVKMEGNNNIVFCIC